MTPPAPADGGHRSEVVERLCRVIIPQVVHLFIHHGMTGG